MPIFSPAISLEIMDGVACAFLAAAASCRARSFGGNFAGSVILGAICGMLAPLVREVFLHGSAGTRMILAAMPDDACIGAIAGALAPAIRKIGKGVIFFWLDAIGAGLASSFTALLAIREMGFVGALTLGVCAGIVPGLCRDVALGDIAMFVEREWYAAAAILGCIMAIATPVAVTLNDGFAVFAARSGELGVLLGMCLCVALRAWKDRGIVE